MNSAPLRGPMWMECWLGRWPG